MPLITEKTAYKLLAGGAALGASLAVRAILHGLYKTGAHEQPPMNPASSDVPWGKAISYTVVTGMAVGLAKLLVRRGTAGGWRKITGRLPQGTNDML